MHHSIWKILFLLGADEYLERMEGKIIITYSFILKYFKITVCTGSPRISWFPNSWSPPFRDSISGIKFVNSPPFRDFDKKKAKKKFFWKNNSKWPTQKKCIFQNRPFSNFFVKITGIGLRHWSSMMPYVERFTKIRISSCDQTTLH